MAAFVDELQQIVSCVSRAVLVPTGYRPGIHPYIVIFGQDAESVALRSAESLRLLVRHHYQIVPVEDAGRRWTVESAGYIYEIRASDETRIAGFHWHPTIDTPYPFPHIHVTDTTGPVNLAKKHIPSGPVALADVLRFAIAELSVEPLRDDWREILDASS